ncbi:Neuroligin-4, X-linked [Armadillidium vulgare]|nr:Neuroligin-4, X-linked [Armadillidium vulgare]
MIVLDHFHKHISNIHNDFRKSVIIFIRDTHLSFRFSSTKFSNTWKRVAYIFGAPLVTELGIFSGNWTPEDEMVSEAMLSYTTNFVKMGNPNFRKGQDFFTKNNQKIHFINQNWEKYDSLYQKYLYHTTNDGSLSSSPISPVDLVTWLVPQLQKVGRLEFLTLRDPEKGPKNEEVLDHLQELSVLHHLFADLDDPSLYAGIVRQVSHMAGHYIFPPSTTTSVPEPSTSQNLSTTKVLPHRPSPPIVPGNASIIAEATMPQNAVDYVSYSTALSVTIAIGVSLLILNILIFAGVYYQKDRTRLDKTSQSSSVRITCQQ